MWFVRCLLLFAIGGCRDWSEIFSGAIARCAEGLVAMGPRCCAEGQVIAQNRCDGKPRRCPVGWQSTVGPASGCVRPSHAVFIGPGEFLVGPNDWESEDVVARQGHVNAFWLDATEVTYARWEPCVAAGACRASKLQGSQELGAPVVSLTPIEASTFCRWSSGRLPRSDEWLLASAGPKGRRFPWGPTGLVCRRAAFGLVRGPCAQGGTTADWPGSRPDGRSESGLYDLVGNVAEMVEASDGEFELRGGSFRSDHASELKSWSSMPYSGPRSDAGFRCAYDQDPAGGAQ